ncbi:MAG: hypothetical protein V5A57_01500 [Candidatus Paceibacterota bacterium]
MAKPELKKKAIKLRKRGLSYKEILEKVPVAKSTLSLWLRDVGLAEKQEQRLTEKKLAAAGRGQKKIREQRERKTEEIKEEAKKEVGEINKRELWIAGIALYWAEGSKERIHNGRTNSAATKFANSDERMIKIYLKWLQEACGISKDRIKFRIYLHENAKDKKDIVQKHWAEVTGFPIEKLNKITWKKHDPKTNRKNTGKDYYGLLEVKLEKSTDFTRKIAGWVEGLCNN